jgi:hypothetical protein
MFPVPMFIRKTPFLQSEIGLMYLDVSFYHIKAMQKNSD